MVSLTVCEKGNGLYVDEGSGDTGTEDDDSGRSRGDVHGEGTGLEETECLIQSKGVVRNGVVI